MKAAACFKEEEEQKIREQRPVLETGLITETRMWLQSGSHAVARTLRKRWRTNEERRGKGKSYRASFSVPAVPFRKQVSLRLYRTEAIHPSVRLPLIPFHLTDSPGVTVKTRSRDNLYHSMTMYSQIFLLQLRGTYEPAVLCCADCPIDRNINRMTAKSITLNSHQAHPTTTAQLA